eukprot:TRINITY_DN12065_c0_g1_i1.p2 TRINITY_DN12065_c0_g1~~TRINITY_DN12065_c0_g1_i1.p2  ORF type:complete len:215 (-),score=35.24 TRINITY_DN12065_c0_g1_i1:550-1194(-)
MLRPQFVCFGDSLTQQAFGVNGWGTMLADKYVRKVDVMNRGYSGYTTRWAVQYLDEIFPTEIKQPQVLATIFFGANDAAPPALEQHVPLNEYKNNLVKIYEHMQKVGISNILYVTPTPVDDEVLEGERLYSMTQKYAEGCMEIAKQLNQPVLDLWPYMLNVENWQKSLLSDGVHLTSTGNKVVFDALSESVDNFFPQLQASQLKQDIPLWREIS